jgi:Raf kinase inhibitor-like YbhB/YbcL family protein
MLMKAVLTMTCSLAVASGLLPGQSAVAVAERAQRASEGEGGGGADTNGATMKITSAAFNHEGAIPRRYTCQGDDVSPQLSWSELPAGTKSLALIVDDPDAPDPKAPKMTWVHWVLYNIPPTVSGLDAGLSKTPPGAADGVNSWKRSGYGGPCPPIGRHRYFHKLYALDTMLPAQRPMTADDLERAMKGHVLAKCQLIGTYQKEP